MRAVPAPLHAEAGRRHGIGQIPMQADQCLRGVLGCQMDDTAAAPAAEMVELQPERPSYDRLRRAVEGWLVLYRNVAEEEQRDVEVAGRDESSSPHPFYGNPVRRALQGTGRPERKEQALALRAFIGQY
jgi:hypothetical protein